MALSTDFKDDVLASSNSKRKYNMIHNPDGTVSFEDVTVYSQEGSDFGAKEVNEEREEINKHTTLLGDTDISSIEDGTVTGALAGLNGKIKFGMWSSTSIPTASWTTIADFTLPDGLYMIMASVNVTSVSAPNAIMGIRLLNNGGAESQKIENYISNQESGMSFFTFVNLTKSTSTVAVQFFHNTGQSIYVGRRHVCVIPVSNTDLI